MKAQLDNMDPAIVAVLFAIVMMASWSLAWRRSHSRQDVGSVPPTSKFLDATMALFGLLLAFTFSMSLSKYEQRRQMAVVDSNAIGDFYTCVSLLPNSPREELQSLVKQYTEHRIKLATSHADEAALQKGFIDTQRMHAHMQALVKDAIGTGTSIAVPLVVTLNALTSSHAARVAAVRDRLPLSILLLLGLAGIFSLAAMGRQHGAAREALSGEMIGFVVLVCFVIWVILDLNDPRRGWITVSQEPLQQLLKSMNQ